MHKKNISDAPDDDDGKFLSTIACAAEEGRDIFGTYEIRRAMTLRSSEVHVSVVASHCLLLPPPLTAKLEVSTMKPQVPPLNC